jgi:hypothetical protein
LGFRIAFAVAILCLPVACDQTLRTGRVGNTTSAPNPDGTCPAGLTVCGQGAFARCLDLQNDPANCGACGNACAPGIACVAGACQQVACTGTVTVSTETVPAGSVNPGNQAILADINGDGRPDLVSWGLINGLNLESVFQVALGQAGGGLGTPTTYQTWATPVSVAAGDANGDAFQDLYVVVWNVSACRVELWLGHADGRLTLGNRSNEIAGCQSATLVDLNGDGKPDLVADIVNGGAGTVFLSDASGSFNGGQPGCVNGGEMVWDWNGDGFPDLVTLYPTLGMCLNKGNGTFDDPIDCGILTRAVIYIGPPTQVTVIADFNRDGHPDLAIAVDNGVDVLLGMGGCQFQPMMEYPLTDVVQVIASGDVNGDGMVDLVALTRDGTLSLLLNGSDGRFQIVPFSVDSPTGFQSGGSLIVGDVTGDGKVDIVFVPGRSPGQAVITDGGITTAPGGVGTTQIVRNTCP